MQDESGDVWLGIDGPGIYRYNGIELKYYGNDHGFNDLSVTSIHQDKYGKIWMATENLKSNSYQGVSYFEAGFFHHLQDAADCPVKSVNTIASDKKGNVWFAGDNGSLVKFNGRSFMPITIPETSVQ
jgi:ligand-binding sensor domain-containing protein